MVNLPDSPTRWLRSFSSAPLSERKVKQSEHCARPGCWKQWRVYFTDIHPTGTGPQRQPGVFSASSPMAGYPKVYNIEMDPHEDLIVGGMFTWVSGPPLKVVEEYLESVKKYPNPPAPNLTRFSGG